MSLPSSPSEDVSHLLVKPESATIEFDFDAPCDYLPDPNIDWVVTVEFKQPVPREGISGVLDIPWLEKHKRPIVYGFSPDEKHWTYVNAADSPESFTSLKVAWSLWDAIDEKPREISLDDPRRLKGAVEERLSVLGQFKIETDRSGEELLPVSRTEDQRDITNHSDSGPIARGKYWRLHVRMIRLR